MFLNLRQALQGALNEDHRLCLLLTRNGVDEVKHVDTEPFKKLLQKMSSDRAHELNTNQFVSFKCFVSTTGYLRQLINLISTTFNPYINYLGLVL